MLKKIQPPETNSNSMFSRIPLALSKFPRLIPISQPLGEYSAIFVCKYCPPPYKKAHNGPNWERIL
jgi:hypothetical protein